MVVFISSPQPRFLYFSDFNVVLVTFPQMNVCTCARVKLWWKLYYANCYLIFLENYLNKWEYFFIFLQNSLILGYYFFKGVQILYSEHQSSHKEQNLFNIFFPLQKHRGVQNEGSVSGKVQWQQPLPRYLTNIEELMTSAKFPLVRAKAKHRAANAYEDMSPPKLYMLRTVHLRPSRTRL